MKRQADEQRLQSAGYLYLAPHHVRPEVWPRPRRVELEPEQVYLLRVRVLKLPAQPEPQTEEERPCEQRRAHPTPRLRPRASLARHLAARKRACPNLFPSASTSAALGRGLP